MGCGTSTVKEQSKEYNAFVEKVEKFLSKAEYSHEFYEQSFKTIPEMEKYILKLKEDEKGEHEDIYYLFLVYFWIYKVIEYKYDSDLNNEDFLDGGIKDLPSDQIPERLTPGGVSILFKKVGEKLGFKIELISGFCKYRKDNDLTNLPANYCSNHMYNAIQIAGRYVFCDISLGKIIERSDNPIFFCATSEIMNYYVYPEDTKYIKDNMLSFDDFKNRINVYPEYFEYKIKKFLANDQKGLVSKVNSPDCNLFLEFDGEPPEFNIKFTHLFRNDLIFCLDVNINENGKTLKPTFKLEAPGLYGYLIELEGKIALEGMIKATYDYKTEGLPNGCRGFTTEELNKYNLITIPFQSEIITSLSPNYSVATELSSVEYFFTKETEYDEMYGSVGYVEDESIFDMEIREETKNGKKGHIMTIKREKKGLAFCAVFLNDETCIAFNVLFL